MLSLLCVLGSIFVVDYLFSRLYQFRPLPSVNLIEIGFVPEVWLSLIGLTLGTLVIAISIASQNIPKIAELYIQDWVSLFYLWFLILGGAHALFVKFHQESGLDATASTILNVYIFLPVSIIFSFSYIFYVLNSIQPLTVVKKVVKTHYRNLHQLYRYPARQLLNVEAYREDYQHQLLESLNQLDNLLEYVTFKELKAEILQDVSLLLQDFVCLKPKVNPAFFKVGPAVRSDISFKTMVDQLDGVEHNRTFYEQKCFRLLGNAYVHLLEESEFDLASLCVSEISKIGSKALAINDDRLLDVLIVRFNTLCRFALKHGVKHNEARNLYNLAFHYRTFIASLVHHDKLQQAQDSFIYLRRYGNEAYAYGHMSSAMYFIVDVIAAEMKKILVLVHEQSWPPEIQARLLDEMLQVDSPPEIDENNPEQPHLNSGVRTLQIGLALFYLKAGQRDFAHRIVIDILDDLTILGKDLFEQAIQRTCDRLRISQPNFWEDTDRGNTNLYYTPDHDQLDAFCELLNGAMVSDRP
ncbi:hypothetical protein C1752_01434 [Acaryochloris thomasi RCC1774]|uniref:DUF2254 domain-containing protein n=1 Tax=Acaryochloris thomasi RCC1774 TaxID=1764569 RepID=A0A2W1JL79_9CYAN|nr:hypothetical protein [Acaryochloris thomasi]PZD74118.1 hypothetical protein C1752_01434 [Acaryochloris thomasi RCC1774]